MSTVSNATNNVANDATTVPTITTVGGAEATKQTLFNSLSKADKEKLRCAYESDRVTLAMFLYAVRLSTCMTEIKGIKKDISEKIKYLGADDALIFASINSPSNLPEGVLDFKIKEADGTKTLCSPFPIGKESSNFTKLEESRFDAIHEMSEIAPSSTYKKLLK